MPLGIKNYFGEPGLFLALHNIFVFDYREKSVGV